MQNHYERIYIAGAFSCQGYSSRSIEEVKQSMQSTLAEKVHPSIIFEPPDADVFNKYVYSLLLTSSISFHLFISFQEHGCLTCSKMRNGFRLESQETLVFIVLI